jgi:ABC-type phosphate transport system substrate-binding protein
MKNVKISSAVALALGGLSGIGAMSAAHAQAVPATPAQCAAAVATLYIAGSSAAQNAFKQALAADLFDTNGETVLSAGGGNGNFRAYCGFAKSGNGAGVAAGSVATVYYRAEGGSVTGALPIASGHTIKMLDITDNTACQIAAPIVNGTSASVGTVDGWTGCVSEHAVEMGITDLEPSQFVGLNYPTAYSQTVFGSANLGTFGFTKTKLFDQVFGLFVNTQGINGATSPAGDTGSFDLSEQTAAAVLSGAYTDWFYVPTASGGQVSSTHQAITLVSRESGSGTRTGASLYFLGANCAKFPATYDDRYPALDGFATGDVLKTASTLPGAITYASIDNNASQPNLTMVSLDGVTPSNLSAASGKYRWWYEATAQKGSITSPGGTSLYTWLVNGELQNIASVPHAPDILAIPGLGTNPLHGLVPVKSSAGAATIYLNPFTRGTTSCNVPQGLF